VSGRAAAQAMRPARAQRGPAREDALPEDASNREDDPGRARLGPWGQLRPRAPLGPRGRPGPSTAQPTRATSQRRPRTLRTTRAGPSADPGDTRAPGRRVGPEPAPAPARHSP